MIGKRIKTIDFYSKYRKNEKYEVHPKCGSKDIFRFMREWSERTRGEFGKSINRFSDGVQKIESGKRGYNMQTFLDVANKHVIK